MNKSFSGRPVKQTVAMKVIRADGRVDDLGVVGYWHKNPLKRLAWKLSRLFLKLMGH